jgi:hypothetical protein
MTTFKRIILCGAFSFVTVWAQPESDVRQHGYQHGFRDGFAYGRQVQATGGKPDQVNQPTDARQGWVASLGPVEEYEKGYRQGFRVGTEDGFIGVTVRLEKLFGQDSKAGKDAADVAEDLGYRDGVDAGLKDAREHAPWRPVVSSGWKAEDRGYQVGFGDKDAYQRTYRMAFEEGYRAAYPNK